jgi:NAD(P)H-dependent FMN reductase
MSAVPLKIAAISGSLRKYSYNTMLINNAIKLSPKGVELTVSEAREYYKG